MEQARANDEVARRIKSLEADVKKIKEDLGYSEITEDDLDSVKGAEEDFREGKTLSHEELGQKNVSY